MQPAGTMRALRAITAISLSNNLGTSPSTLRVATAGYGSHSSNPRSRTETRDVPLSYINLQFGASEAGPVPGRRRAPRSRRSIVPTLFITAVSPTQLPGPSFPKRRVDVRCSPGGCQGVDRWKKNRTATCYFVSGAGTGSPMTNCAPGGMTTSTM